MALTTEDKVWIAAKIKAISLTTEDKVWIDKKITKVINAISQVPAGSGGLTAAQVRQAVKDALREGTGR